MEHENPFLLSNSTVSRRMALQGSLIGLGSLLASRNAAAQPCDFATQEPNPIPVKLRTALREEIVIHARPRQVYNALLNSKLFAEFSGEPAVISTKAGGAISMFGGKVTGRNIEVLPDQRIVQAWRPGSWKPGVYSIVKFELKPDSDQTTVILDHTGFPEGDFESLSDGWMSHYWKPLQKYFP